MILHTIKIIWNQRRFTSWLLLFLTLAFSFSWFLLDSLIVETVAYSTPSGFNINHTYKLELSRLNSYADSYVEKEAESTSDVDDLLRLVEQVKQHPAIANACLSIYSTPYSSGAFMKQLRRDSAIVSSYERVVSDDFFNVFQVYNKNKQSILPSTNFEAGYIVVSEDVEQQLYPNSSAVGEKITVENRETSSDLTISSVSTPIKREIFENPEPCIFSPLQRETLERFVKLYIEYIEFSVRIYRSNEDTFLTNFKKEMGDRLRVNNIYVSSISSMQEEKELILMTDYSLNQVKMKLAGIGFVLINIFFGVISTFWLRTQQRQSELGLRIAMGSDKRKLRRFIAGEGFLLLSIAALISIPIFLTLLWADKVETARLDFTVWRAAVGFVTTYLLIALMILLGIWYPVRKVKTIQAAEALNSKK